MENLSFNWDVLYISVLLLAIIILLRLFIPKFWTIWHKESYVEHEFIFKRVMLTLIYLAAIGVIVFTLLLGYETKEPHEQVGTEYIKKETKHLKIPTQEEIEAESKALAEKKHLEKEAQIKKEKEESEKAYQDALNN